MMTHWDNIDADGNAVVGRRAGWQADQLAVQLLEATEITELKCPPEAVSLAV